MINAFLFVLRAVKEEESNIISSSFSAVRNVEIRLNTNDWSSSERLAQARQSLS